MGHPGCYATIDTEQEVEINDPYDQVEEKSNLNDIILRMVDLIGLRKVGYREHGQELMDRYRIR